MSSVVSRWGSLKARGFTLVEVLIAIAVIAILAVIVVVGYGAIQKRAASAAVKDTLLSAQKAVQFEETYKNGAFPGVLPEDFIESDEIIVKYYPNTADVVYHGLSPVQNGVLFHSICEELIVDPYYTTIHAREGGSTQTVVASCNHNVSGRGMLITGWHSKLWETPVTVAKIETFKATIPYDSWWIDRQEVIHRFYDELMRRFEARGGTWPITSFWDTWANEWSGVHKDPLPEPSVSGNIVGYCLVAVHRTYFQEERYIVTSDDKTVRRGSCES